MPHIGQSWISDNPDADEIYRAIVIAEIARRDEDALALMDHPSFDPNALNDDHDPLINFVLHHPAYIKKILKHPKFKIIKHRNKHGQSFLGVARYRGYTETTRLLEQAGFKASDD